MLAEVVVDALDGDGAFADRGGHSFAGPVTYVPGREDAWEAGLQQQGEPVRRPARW
jgi:hypothetical protein